MPLYPTTEDLIVENLLQDQTKVFEQYSGPICDVYANAAGFMGLTLDSFCYNDEGELVPTSSVAPSSTSTQLQPASSAGLVQNVTSQDSSIIPRTPCSGEIKQGVRRLVLCKDAKGKVGVQLRSVDAGVFVSFVQRSSPAAIAGLRFGDQILSICDELVAGYSGNKAMQLFRKAPVNNIVIIVRDRPFERTVKLHKDSSGELGFVIRDGFVKSIVKDSSAARNGLLINHKIVEVNGQNVLGLKDKVIRELIQRSSGMVSVTILPNVIYQHLVNRLHGSQLKHEMDRSFPDA